MSSELFFVLVLIGMLIFVCISFYYFDSKRALRGVVYFIIGAMIGVIGFGHLGDADQSVETIYTSRPLYERQLINLRSSKDIHCEGIFFSQSSLLSNTTSGEFSLGSYDTFRYAYRDDSGAIRFESIAIKDTVVYDNLAEGEAPYIAIEQIFGTKHDRLVYGKIGFIEIKNDDYVSDLGAVDMAYTIYVPPGTITEYLDFG